MMKATILYLILMFPFAAFAEETTGEQIQSTGETVLFELKKAARFTADSACKIVKNGKCVDEAEETARRNAEEKAKIEQQQKQRKAD